MKLNQTILSSAVAAGLSLSAGSAFAQAEEAAADAAPATEESAEAPAEEAAVEEEAPAEEAAAEEEAPAEEAAAEEEAPVEEEAAEEEAVEEEAPEAPAAEDAKEEEASEEEEEAGGSPSLMVFADAWAGWQSAKSGTPGGGGGVYANNGPFGTAQSGFGLNWLGADAGYDAGDWAVNGSLRFGDAVAIYGTGTLGPITNAYVTYRPAEGLSLDMGAFGTIYGAEVAESWQNLNYTRGELYFNMQPFWHTGLRAEYATGDFVARALVVNDANNSNLGEGAINGGLQLGYDNGESFGVYLGGLQSFLPETTVTNGGFVDTFFDAVVTVSAGDLSVIGNFDMNLGYEAQNFWGASLAAGYQIVPAFGVALRGEYLSSPDNFLFGIDDDGDGAADAEYDNSLITGTVTLDLKPVPEQENFVVRLDGRLEVASDEVYANADADDTTDMWQSVTLGVVGYHNLL